MDWKLFSRYYLIFLIPIFINILFTFIQFIKYHSYNKVFVSKTLQVICYSATFFALFGFLSNLIDYVTGNDWFLLMMLTCYVVLNVILIILRNEKILYNQSTGVKTGDGSMSYAVRCLFLTPIYQIFLIKSSNSEIFYKIIRKC